MLCEHVRTALQGRRSGNAWRNARTSSAVPLPPLSRSSFLTRKHIQTSLAAIFAVVNGSGPHAQRRGQPEAHPQRMTLTRFRRIYAACPENFAVREILARPDEGALEQSPERRATAAWAAAAGPEFEDSPSGSRAPLRPTTRRVRRNLASAAPSKRVRVVGSRPASPTGAVGPAEAAEREAVEAQRLSAALPLAGGARRLVDSGALDEDALPGFVGGAPRLPAVRGSPEGGLTLCTAARLGALSPAPGMDASAQGETYGPTARASSVIPHHAGAVPSPALPRDESRSEDDGLTSDRDSVSDSDSDGGGGFLARATGGASAASAPHVALEVSHPPRVDILRRPGIAEESQRLGTTSPSAPTEAECLGANGPSKPDLSMVELTLRPVGSSMQRSSLRVRQFRAKLLWRLQAAHDGASIALVQRTIAPGGKPPTQRRVAGGAERGRLPDPKAWRENFQPESVALPPPAHVIGVGCLCGLPVPADDYEFAVSCAASHPRDDQGPLVGSAAASASSACDSQVAAARPGLPSAAATLHPDCTFASVETYLRAQPWYVDQLRHVHTILPRPAKFRDVERPVHPAIRMAMHAR